jgi:hypothetical protein
VPPGLDLAPAPEWFAGGISRDRLVFAAEGAGEVGGLGQPTAKWCCIALTWLRGPVFRPWCTASILCHDRPSVTLCWQRRPSRGEPCLVAMVVDRRP